MSPAINVHFSKGNGKEFTIWMGNEEESEENLSDMEKSSNLLQSTVEKTDLHSNREAVGHAAMETQMGQRAGDKWSEEVSWRTEDEPVGAGEDVVDSEGYVSDDAVRSDSDEGGERTNVNLGANAISL